MAAAPLVSIVIPTMRRPEPLAAAMTSALAQMFEGAELVVVDNDPEGSAAAQVAALDEGAAMPVRYIHAPEPGVANARNAGVAAARGPLIAFLDDDEIAPPGWLAALMAVQAALNADAVFGPVRARLPDGPVAHRDYLTRFFSRLGPAEASVIADAYGCGCSLVRRAALPHTEHPFSMERNAIGGEDDLLFGQMKAAGARFAFAPDAWVWEVPEPARLTLAYALRRAFAFGQGPCSAAAAKGPVRWPLIPLWMAVGVAQLVGHGARAAVEAVIGAPQRADSLDRAARGLGKILWFSPFKIGFYGQGALAAHRRTQGETHGRHH